MFIPSLCINSEDCCSIWDRCDTDIAGYNRVLLRISRKSKEVEGKTRTCIQYVTAVATVMLAVLVYQVLTPTLSFTM